MSPEYMAELHKFLYQSNDSDIDRLKNIALEHLKHLPKKTLYRYRRCNNDEFDTLKNNSIWLADPHNFPDMFDATLPTPDMSHIDLVYTFFFAIEAGCKAILATAEEGEQIPNKEDYLSVMYETLETYMNYTQEEIDKNLVDLLGEAEFIQMRKQKLPEIDFSPQIKQVKKYLDSLSISPRDSLAIASFTTSYDNRNMWENYSEKYTGFCVEYNFSNILSPLNIKGAWDILHLLPVKYYKKRPTFDFDDIIHSFVQSHMHISEIDIDADNFLSQYYRSITSKFYDYRAEHEWRLIMERDHIGKYPFPYVKQIYIGKDMSDKNMQTLLDIAKELCVPVRIQSISSDKNTFEYPLL